MTTLRQSVQINLPSISADGYEPIAIVGDFVVPAGLVATDVIEMGILPAGYVPLSTVVLADDCDSNGTPLFALNAGLISGAPRALDNTRTCGTEIFAASTVGQAGGTALGTNAAFGFLAPSDTHRSFGLGVSASAATLTVGARLRMTVLARPALNGV